jgi:dTMP kinase
MPGHFVSFEGGEACGKSTQVARLIRKLESLGHQVLSIREPGSTQAGEAIRNLLLHSDKGISLTPAAELLLFGASRAQVVEEVIRPGLNAGKIVANWKSLFVPAYGQRSPFCWILILRRSGTGGYAESAR